MVKPDNYILVYGWMVTELGLKGNELFLYAIIYGFSQDGETEFSGSLRYMQEWLGVEQMQTEVEQLTDTIAADQSVALTYAGEFHCTAYCSEEYPHICGEGQGITSSGAKVQPGVTVAADTSIFPYGTVILIEGVGMRVVQDTGSLIKENALDVAVGTHAEAIAWSGWGSHKVWIVTGGETDAAE